MKSHQHNCITPCKNVKSNTYKLKDTTISVHFYNTSIVAMEDSQHEPDSWLPCSVPVFPLAVCYNLAYIMY